jgi:hypothetical protein
MSQPLDALTALHQIASTSPPARTLPNGSIERCHHCHALIDHAREALRLAPWPAPYPSPLPESDLHG